MGCDIHGYLDYDEFTKRDGTPYVSCFARDIGIPRNYVVFALMAGVRYYPSEISDYKPLFEPRGLPQNISWRTQDAYNEWGADAHTPSYLYVDELEQVQTALTKIVRPEMAWTQPANQALTEEQKLAGAKIFPISDDREYVRVEVGERTPLQRSKALDAVIATMRSLNGDNPQCSRFVFWFDN